MPQLPFLSAWSNKLILNNLNPQNKDLLLQFFKLKSSMINNEPDYTKRISAVRNFNPANIGVENWAIGLIGMLYDKNNQNNKLLLILNQQILKYLHQFDAFITSAYLKAVDNRLEWLPIDCRIIISNHISSKNYLSLINNQKWRVYEKSQILRLIENIVTKSNTQKVKLQYVKQVLTNSEKKVTHTQTNTRDINNLNLKTNLTEVQSVQKSFRKNKNESKLYGFTLLNYLVLSPKLLIYLLLNHENRTDNKNKTIPNEIALISVLPLLTKASQSIFLQEDPVHQIKAYHDKFNYLLDQQFDKVLVLTPDATSFPSYFFAKNAAKAMSDKIIIIDTKSIGVAYQTLVDEVQKLIIQKKTIIDLKKQISKLIQKKKHFVLFTNKNMISESILLNIKNHETLKEKVLLTFDGSIKNIESNSKSEELINIVLSTVKQFINKESSYKIKINYSINQRDAFEIYNILNNYFDNIIVKIEPSSANIVKKFGPHISIFLNQL